MAKAKKSNTQKNEVAVAFGHRMRAIREANGISVSEAAEASGLAYSAYARLERGEREPSLSTIVRVMNALRCQPGDLIH